MKLILAIGAGSFIGGICRYLLSLWIHAKMATHFPLGTLTVNIIGCFFIGIVIGFFGKGLVSHEWKLFLTIGVLGGFTTFSAFSIETFTLFRDGHTGYALIYILTSVLVGLLVTYVGYLMVK